MSPRSQYDAFISYSHRERALARKLERALELFARPRYKARIIHVFRDDTVLPANSGLWSSIEAALDNSRYLIVIGSPDAASSPWVCDEVEYWLRRKSCENVMIAVARGRVPWDRGGAEHERAESQALPARLLEAMGEPRFVDLRWLTDGKPARSDPRFQDAVADLGAPLHGRPKDELVGEDVRMRRTERRLRQGAVAALASLVLIAAGLAAYAFQQRNTARNQRDLAVSRGLAATARTKLSQRFDLAALLSLEAYRAKPTPEAFDAAFTAVQRSEPLVATLHGHGAVSSIAWRRDARVIAAGRTDGTIRLWNAATRRPVAAVRAVDRQKRQTGPLWVRSVAWNARGDLLASGGDDGTVRLWDAALQAIAVLRPGSRRVRSVAFSPSGLLLASGGDDTSVRLWDVSSHDEVAVLEGHTDTVRSVAFGPRGRMLASGSADGTVRLWDVQTRHLLRRLVYGDVVRAIGFSPDGKVLAAAGDDDAIHLWDTGTGRPIGDPLRGHTSWVRALAFSADGTILASAGDDQTIRLWDIRARRPLGAPLIGNGDVVRSVAFSRDGTLASGAEDWTVRLWSLSGIRLPQHEAPYVNLALAAAFGAGAQTLAAGDRKGVTLWSVPRHRARGGRLAAGKRVDSVALSPDGKLLAAGGEGGLLWLWELPSRRLVAAPVANGGAVYALACSVDSRHLASGGEHGARLWDVGTRRLRGGPALDGSAKTVRSVTFDPTGDQVAAGDEGGVVRVWDVPTGRPIGRLRRVKAAVRSLLWQDGRLLAGDEDGKITLWQGNTSPPPSVTGHTERVDSLAIDSRERALVVSGSDDRTIRIWDLAEARELGDPVAAGNGIVLALGLTRDGQLAWATSDLTFGVRRSVLWSGDVDAYAARLCAIVGEDIPEGKWNEFVPDRGYHATCGSRADQLP